MELAWIKTSFVLSYRTPHQGPQDNVRNLGTIKTAIPDSRFIQEIYFKLALSTSEIRTSKSYNNWDGLGPFNEVVEIEHSIQIASRALKNKGLLFLPEICNILDNQSFFSRMVNCWSGHPNLSIDRHKILDF